MNLQRQKVKILSHECQDLVCRYYFTTNRQSSLEFSFLFSFAVVGGNVTTQHIESIIFALRWQCLHLSNMAKSKNLPPLTEYHQKHLDNFRDARKIGEIEAFDFTIQHLQHYTAILSTCLHVKELYQRLSRNLTERTANAQIETGRLRVVKSERRAVAPQLLMGLRDLAIAMANLELEHRKERSVVDSQRLVIAERNKVSNIDSNTSSL